MAYGLRNVFLDVSIVVDLASGSRRRVTIRLTWENEKTIYYTGVGNITSTLFGALNLLHRAPSGSWRRLNDTRKECRRPARETGGIDDTRLSLGERESRSQEQEAGAQSSLVDPASSHMLVSKIKPCMSQCMPN